MHVRRSSQVIVELKYSHDGTICTDDRSIDLGDN